MRIERALGLHDQFAHITRGTASPWMLGNPVCVLFHEGMRILYGDRQTCNFHHRQINDIISGIRGLFRRNTQLIQQVMKGVQLVQFTLVDIFDTEIAHTVLDNLGVTCRDHTDFDTGLLQQFHAQAIARIEGLVFLSVITEEQATVREYAIHIEDDEFDVGGFFEDILHAWLRLYDPGPQQVVHAQGAD